MKRPAAPVFSLAVAASRLAKRGDQTLVLTNGVFDLLHPGHTFLLAECSKLGDLVAVGVNCDAAVRAAKGPGRPLQGLTQRLAVLSAVRWVDFLIPFPQADAGELIAALRPDIYVKGSEYDPAGANPRPLPELESTGRFGVKCHYVAMELGHSTTGLARRITADRMDQ